MSYVTDRELLFIIAQKVHETAARAVRIETRVSKLLVELGLSHDGTAVVDASRLPEALPPVLPSCKEPAA